MLLVLIPKELLVFVHPLYQAGLPVKIVIFAMTQIIKFNFYFIFGGLLFYGKKLVPDRTLKYV